MTTADDIASAVISALEMCNSHTAMIENIVIKPQTGNF